METESKGRKRKEKETGSGREKWSKRREMEMPLLLLLLLAWADKRYFKAKSLLKNHFNVCSEGMEIRAPCSHTSIQRCTAHCCFLFFFSQDSQSDLVAPCRLFMPDTNGATVSLTNTQSVRAERGRERRGKSPSITQAPLIIPWKEQAISCNDFIKCPHHTCR